MTSKAAFPITPQVNAIATTPWRTNPMGEATAAHVHTLDGVTPSLEAVRMMEGYAPSGVFAAYGAKPMPQYMKGGRRTALVTMSQHRPVVRPVYLIRTHYPSSTCAPATMYPYRHCIQRPLADSLPLP